MKGVYPTITYDNKSIDAYGEQVLLGAVLGGSSILKTKLARNYFLSMKSPNPKWLVWKIQAMRQLFKDEDLIEQNGSYRCHSYACKFITTKHEAMYEGTQRRITEKLLDGMRDIGLAAWCIEGGGRTGNGKRNFYLTMTRFTLEDTIFTMKYFNNFLELPCIVKDYGRYRRLQFTVYGSDKLIAMIQPHVPDFIK